jgi:hypothetical protein
MNDECRKSVTCLQQIGPPKSCSSVPSLFLPNSRSLVNKIDELSGTVSNLLADIVVITETWLTSNVDSAVIKLSGSSIFRRDREDGRRGGGVCAYVNNCLPVVHLRRVYFTGRGSQDAGHRSRVTGHGSQVAGHRLLVTGHGSQVTDLYIILLLFIKNELFCNQKVKLQKLLAT